MGSHGSEKTENIKTKHLSGVTGLKSSVVIEYAYKKENLFIPSSQRT